MCYFTIPTSTQIGKVVQVFMIKVYIKVLPEYLYYKFYF